MAWPNTGPFVRRLTAQTALDAIGRRLVPLTTVAALAYGCTTMSVPEFKTKSASSYAARAEKNGLLLAVHPTTDAQEMDDTFKVDLLEGTLPVLLVTENRSPSTNFVIPRDKIAVFDADMGAGTAGHHQGKEQPDVAAGALVLASGGAMLVAPVLALPLLVSGMKLSSDAMVIQHNLAEKAMYSHTLAPGQSARGYVYVRLPKNLPPVSRYNVVIDAVDSSTGEITTLSIPVEYRRRGR
jgi:hypothetical protein